MAKPKNTNATRELCYTAVAVALICVCAWIAVPIGSIPITLQSLAVCLIAGLLGVKRSFFAMLAYLLLGIIGVPVFSGFTGGIGTLLFPTGGYLIGFVIAAPLISLLCKIFKKGVLKTALSMLIGVAVCYALGTIWFMLLSGSTNTPIGLWSALSLCVLPYLPFDVIKIGVAAILSNKLKDKIR